jgi:uridine kinase
MDARPVLELIASMHDTTDIVLVGVGGHGGAGKTTLARMIPGAQIVSTDEFWDGEEFDIERLSREVVTPLSRGAAAHFASYDWAAGKQRGSRTIEPTGVVVVEGVCALHRSLRNAYAVRVWVEAPYDLRLERGVARDGEAARSTWVDVWMPSEDRYVERDDPVSSAHLIVDGSRSREVEGA